MRTFFGRRYKDVKHYEDRHGKWRTYYRPTGRDLPNPKEVKFRVFDQAYWEAVAAGSGGVEVRDNPDRKTLSRPETVEKAVREYVGSPAFDKLADATKVSRKNLLENWAKGKAGALMLSTLRKEHIENGLESRSPTTGANWFYAVRALIQWCIAEKKYGVRTDPTQGVKLKAREKGDGFPSWTEADVPIFIKRWPKGTMQYRALMVLLWSGQRRKDVVTFGWDAFEGDMMKFRQSKTKRWMRLPIPPSLLEVLPPRNVVGLADPLPFLLTPRDGTPFSPAYFTNWFHAACLACDPPLDLSPHGTRKLAAQQMYRTALRAGRTDALALTMAFTGHKTEKQLRVYLGDDFEQEEYAGELAAFMR